MDKIKLSDASVFLQKAFNCADLPDGEKYVRNAILALEESVKSADSQQGMKVIRASDYKPKPREQQYLKSGCDWLDKLLFGGIRQQELFLLAGEPFSGKTHLLAYIAGQYLLEGYKVLAFNGEDIIDDILTIYSSVTGEAPKENLYVADVVDSSFTAERVEQTVREVEADHGKIDFVIIDHMDIMQTDSDLQDWRGIDKLAKELRHISKRNNLSVLCGSQLKDSTNKGFARLHGGKVVKAQHPDIIWYIDNTDGQILVSIKKARGRKVTIREAVLDTDFDTMSVNLLQAD